MDTGSIVLLIISEAFLFLMQKDSVRQLQLGGYKPLAIFSRNRDYLLRYLPVVLISAVFAAIVPTGSFISIPQTFTAVLIAVFYIAVSCILFYNYKKTVKNPFVITARASRLYVAAFLAVTALNVHILTRFQAFGTLYNGSSVFIMPILLPFIVSFTASVAYPCESLNNRRYVLRAKKRLDDNPLLIKIGITGSFGKTSVKNILSRFLQSKYCVVASMGNYNTPLGIAKSTGLIDSYTDVFIAEMGARHVGDIKELFDIVRPNYAIVTGVTDQHLETFKSVDNIRTEKLSLISALPSNGYGVINRSGFDTKIEFDTVADVDTVGGEGDICFASDATLSADGAEFTLNLDGKAYTANTKLLGAHNLQNIVSAAAIAYKLKIPPERIVAEISMLPQVPHRLQLIKNGGITVIDDTYNSNPVGAREALSTLSLYNGRKVVITPGMVELGLREDAENKNLGVRIAAVADLVILIGIKRAQQIREGLISAGYDDDDIINYKSLAEAERDFGKLLLVGDTVLFLNDLPDGYSE